MESKHNQEHQGKSPHVIEIERQYSVLRLLTITERLFSIAELL